jgi:predicted enzyme related to lactoylglutathione lyase
LIANEITGETIMEKLGLKSFVLFVDDVLVSMNFYKEILDQEISLNINNINVGFKSGLALWKKQYAQNVIFEKEMSTKTSNNSEIYFETLELDEVFERIQKNNVKILHSIKVQPWQQRVFRIYDPDDNIVEIAETMEVIVKRLKNEGMSIELIAEKTFMPKEIVESFLKM